MFEWFGMGERVLFEPLQRFSDALFHRSIKRIDILDGSVGI